MLKKKRLWIFLFVIAALLLLLFIVWLVLPTAAEATGLDEYDTEDITHIVLVPRPGSGDPQIELTSAEEIGVVLDWFSGVKVRTARSGAAVGSTAAVLFYTNENEKIRIDIQSHRKDAYVVSGPLGDGHKNLVCIRPRVFEHFWTDLLGQ